MELVQSDTSVFRHPVTSDKIYGHKVFLLTKVKPEYSDILYNLTHFPGPLQLVCQFIQIPLCMIQLSVMKIRGIYWTLTSYRKIRTLCGKQDEIGIT